MSSVMCAHAVPRNGSRSGIKGGGAEAVAAAYKMGGTNSLILAAVDIREHGQGLCQPVLGVTGGSHGVVPH